jgi:hypothetical protein
VPSCHSRASSFKFVFDLSTGSVRHFDDIDNLATSVNQFLPAHQLLPVYQTQLRLRRAPRLASKQLVQGKASAIKQTRTPRHKDRRSGETIRAVLLLPANFAVHPPFTSLSRSQDRTPNYSFPPTSTRFAHPSSDSIPAVRHPRVMSADGKPSHARNTSNESHRPSLNTQQPDPNSHIVVKGLPKSVLKKRSADEHTALLNSQREAAAAASGAAQDGGDYFGDIDDEDDWGESKSTWYMILLTLAIGG